MGRFRFYKNADLTKHAYLFANLQKYVCDD